MSQPVVCLLNLSGINTALRTKCEVMAWTVSMAVGFGGLGDNILHKGRKSNRIRLELRQTFEQMKMARPTCNAEDGDGQR